MANDLKRKISPTTKTDNTSLKQYQGEITYKDDIQRKFREMIESHKSGSAHLNTTDLENIRYLLEFLIENLRSNYVNVNL